MKLKPFQALRPPPEWAASVASPPYDVMDTAEAAALADGLPMSFLHVIRPEIDLPVGTDLYDEAVYTAAATRFQQFQDQGYLVRDPEARLFVYAQTMGEHTQYGVVGVCHVEDYEHNLIRKHEDTIRKKEDDRTRHVQTLRAHTGPVFLAYRDDEAIDAAVAAASAGVPLYDFTASDGVRHTVWPVKDAEALVALFKQVPLAYVADGHHRTASAARAAQACRAANPAHTGNEAYNWFLSVLFPAGQLNILPYNRCVSDLNGMNAATFLERLHSGFDVEADPRPEPREPGRFSLFLEDRWYGVSWDPDPAADPVARLDVSVLQDRVLQPLLDIEHPRTDPRLSFVGGIRGPAELERRVRGGLAAIAFSMAPVTIEQLLDVADAGRNMPPKSTWFEPKLRSGLLVHDF